MGWILSDTWLALTSPEISLLKLSEGERKQKTPSFPCHVKPYWRDIEHIEQGYSFSFNYPFTLPNSGSCIECRSLYNEEQNKSRFGQITGVCSGREPQRNATKGQSLTLEAGIRKSSGVKLAGHGQRDTEGLENQGSMQGVHGEISVLPTAGKKGGRLLHTDDLPAGFTKCSTGPKACIH